MLTSVYITSATRTPIGNFQGELASLTAIQLGAIAIKAALEQSQLNPQQINAVIMGCVLSAGLGQAPARQASIAAELPYEVDCTTINKMCGSGMKAIMLAFDLIATDSDQIIIAGGMESMSNAPYLLPKARAGYRLGHQQVLDHLFFDGLEDAYEKGNLMGIFAERCALQNNFSREEQDQFAIASLTKAIAATVEDKFQPEIIPIEIMKKKEKKTIDQDEGPQTAKMEKIPTLQPVFAKEGTITAANASSISDGAAAVVVMSENKLQTLSTPPLARIIGHATHSQEPAQFTTAPVVAIEKLLKKIGWATEQVDLWEINEAFAVVTLHAIHTLKLAPDRVNVNGGACTLGHPIGASGARIVVTLIHALKQRGLTKGIAALCIGGGEATALAVEIV